MPSIAPKFGLSFYLNVDSALRTLYGPFSFQQQLTRAAGESIDSGFYRIPHENKPHQLDNEHAWQDTFVLTGPQLAQAKDAKQTYTEIATFLAGLKSREITPRNDFIGTVLTAARQTYIDRLRAITQNSIVCAPNFKTEEPSFKVQTLGNQPMRVLKAALLEEKRQEQKQQQG